MLFETARLVVRRLTVADAPFIRGLVTEPGWLRWIGSRDVETVADAERYLREGPLASYAAHGHGLYLVSHKGGEPVGICGILRRPTLDAPDLGYAVAARHAGKGYATEAARATLAHARRDLGLARVVAITDADHAASHRVLTKAGMRRAGTVPDDDGPPLTQFETSWGDPAPAGQV
ncbi:GNAT family N-acetyltransferase [Rubrivirga sp. IMCC43871]|uniref:GNAT family N-acetyltransferase n=1 Tax=Rubrivirga sp. IMCC43871 TaxID=3391575 RepID=UPI00398F96D4